MINISLDKPKVINEGAVLAATKNALELLYKELRIARGATPAVYFDNTNKTVRTTYFPLEWLLGAKEVGLSQEQVLAAYELSMLGTSSEHMERSLFTEVTGISDASIREIRGFKTPLRALMLCLWKYNYLLLPIAFKQNGIFPMVPGLQSHLKNFFTEVAEKSTSGHLKKYLTCTQYTLNWHAKEDVVFSEAWAVIPEIADKRKDKTSTKFKSTPFRRYSILAWLEECSYQYPNLISSEQVRLILRYSITVGVSKHGSYTFNTPEDFSEYDKKTLGEKRNLQVKSHNARERIKLLISSMVASNDSSEIYYASLTIRNRENFAWLDTSGYPRIDRALLDELSKDWKPYLHAYYTDLIDKNLSKTHRKKLLSPVYKLCDYLFGYLPLWREENPQHLIPIPLRVDDFSTAFFWKRLLPTKSPLMAKLGPLPKTLMEAFSLRSAQTTSASFVSGIYHFFDFCIDNSERLEALGANKINSNFQNPTKLSDAPGSGSRPGATDKMVVPAYSVGMIRNYVTALNSVGVQLREICLSGKLEQREITTISRLDWIDLTALGLSQSFEMKSPFESGENITINLMEIPNCFSWITDNYNTDLNGNDQIYTTVPWLSSLRMISIALFAGQRLQGAQWLGLDNYRSLHHEGQSYWTTLFLATDKIHPNRACRLQRPIMQWLDDEAYFQTYTCGTPPQESHYENDPHSDIPKQRWLFRSPRGEVDTPFSDTTYFDKWIRILRGIDSVWNDIAPKAMQYKFVTETENTINSKKSGTVKFTSPHSPHSLRNSYITWMIERGDAEHYEVMRQVGHTNIGMTYHYASGQRPGTDYSMEIADQRIESIHNELFQNAMTGSPVKPSRPNSALRESLSQNRDAAIAAQGMISLNDGLITVQETGYELIKITAIDELGVFDNCICPFNGRCTAVVLAKTKGPRRCGMCPYAIYAFDHLEGINACMRRLQKDIPAKRTKIKELEFAAESEQIIQPYRESVGLDAIELCGWEQVSKLLTSMIETAKKTKKRYLVRKPEIFDKYPVNLDANDPIQKIVSELLDVSHHPAFTNDNYLTSLRRAARALSLPDPDSGEVVGHTAAKIALGQIAAQMKMNGWSLTNLSDRFKRIFPTALTGIEHGQ
jgi:hypothetical protein